jgi:hypothetical protein
MPRLGGVKSRGQQACTFFISKISPAAPRSVVGAILFSLNSKKALAISGPRAKKRSD